MIVSVLLFILFFAFVSSFLFFIFYMLLPALHGHGYKTEQMLLPLGKSLHNIAAKKADTASECQSRAIVQCSPDKTMDKRFEYKDIKTCRLFYSIYVTQNDCVASCIGFGDCMHECPQQAIIIKNSTAVVTDLCTGCGKCLSICPKHLIKLLPASNKKAVFCAATSEHTKCNMCMAESDYSPPKQPAFKFWHSCYTLLSNKIWKK